MRKLALLLLATAASAATQYMLIGNGQSLSLGDTGCNAISTSQPGSNQTWNGSSLVALTETGACAFGGNAWSSGATFQPYATVSYMSSNYETLSQSTNQTPGSAPWVSATTQESPLSSAANNASALASFSMIAKNFGQTGTPIATWCSSSAVTNIGNTVTAVKSAISPNTLVVIGVMVTAGESDFASGSTTYYSDSRTCQSNIQSAVQAITGQSQPVPFIYSQMTSTEQASPYGYTCADGVAQSCLDSYPVSGTANHVPIAQYQLARDFPSLFYLAGPKYQYDYGSNQGYHLSAHGYNMLGATAARVLACLYAAGFSATNSCAGGVIPQTPIYVNGTTVTLHVTTPGGISLDQPANSSETTGNWSNTVIPVPYYGSTPAQHTSNYGFQFFTSNGEIAVNSVSVSGTVITLTLASVPTGANWQLAYGWEGVKYAYTPVWGCAWNATTCNGINTVNGSSFASGTPHGNIRTVADFTSLNSDSIYHWMVHFIENAVPIPPKGIITGGQCAGCLIAEARQ